MNYTTMDIKSIEFENLFGKLLEATDTDKSYGRNHSYIHYIGGIPNFEEFLGGLKFSNTDLKHYIIVYEKGIVFLLMGKNESINFNILKKDLESIVSYHNQDIEICDVNQVLNIMKTGFSEGGVAGVLITSATGHIADAVLKRFKTLKSKTIKGSVYELRVNSESGEKYTIRVSCRDDHKFEVNQFWDKHFNFRLSQNDPKNNCFIATVCYGNPLSDEILLFKKYRDTVLNKNYLGRLFIKYYYSISPSLSNKLYNKKNILKLIRKLFLNPIYIMLKRKYNK